jgi:predicted Zn-dependent protease
MKQLFIVVVGFVLLATIPILVQTQVQAQSTTSTYENPAIGLKFEYPAEWELRNNSIGLTMSPDEDSVFSLEVVSLDRLGIHNSTLKDYAQYGYQLCCGTMSTPINDNQTTIGQNYNCSAI